MGTFMQKRLSVKQGVYPRLQTYHGREVPNSLTIEVFRADADINAVMSDVLALKNLTSTYVFLAIVCQ